MCWYFWNSASHAARPSGGKAPVTGRHSVIDRPDPVRRVEPPSTTIANTRAATAKSHTATGRDIS